MKTEAHKFKTVDEYIATFPEQVRGNLEALRATVKQVVPAAIEVISYNMPAFKLHGILLYYAAYKNHIGLYPYADTIIFFEADLAAYKTSKGTVQFPLDKALPLGLIKKMVKYSVNENLQKEKAKKEKKN